MPSVPTEQLVCTTAPDVGENAPHPAPALRFPGLEVGHRCCCKQQQPGLAAGTALPGAGCAPDTVATGGWALAQEGWAPQGLDSNRAPEPVPWQCPLWQSKAVCTGRGIRQTVSATCARPTVASDIDHVEGSD